MSEERKDNGAPLDDSQSPTGFFTGTVLLGGENRHNRLDSKQSPPTRAGHKKGEGEKETKKKRKTCRRRL